MSRGRWVSGTSGLRGPRALVAHAEQTLNDEAQARDEGFVVLERPEPLITVLLFLGLASRVPAPSTWWLSTVTSLRDRWWLASRRGRLTSSGTGSYVEVPMYVCLCQGLKESDVERAARAGHTTPEALIAALKLRDPKCCGRCAGEIDRLVRVANTASNQTAGTSR